MWQFQVHTGFTDNSENFFRLNPVNKIKWYRNLKKLKLKILGVTWQNSRGLSTGSIKISNLDVWSCVPAGTKSLASECQATESRL